MTGNGRCPIHRGGDPFGASPPTGPRATRAGCAVTIPTSGAWLSWLERSLHTAEVGGSSPPAPTATVLLGPSFLERLSCPAPTVPDPRAMATPAVRVSHGREAPERGIDPFGWAGKQVAMRWTTTDTDECPGAARPRSVTAPQRSLTTPQWVRGQGSARTAWQLPRPVERTAAAKRQDAWFAAGCQEERIRRPVPVKMRPRYPDRDER